MADRRERPKDHLVAAHLAAGLSVVSVAERVGCHERTIRKRLEDSAFRAKVDALKAEIVGRAVALLGRSMVTAARQLLKLTTGAKSESVRRAAAKDLLDMAIRARAGEDVERQMRELIEQVDRIATKQRAGR